MLHVKGLFDVCWCGVWCVVCGVHLYYSNVQCGWPCARRKSLASLYVGKGPPPTPPPPPRYIQYAASHSLSFFYCLACIDVVPTCA
ncbi:hypothetical protein BCV70DRAFT_20796 [Testicularia cyperi]|uniref:Uncharacterized protein n=1 Tax=Testicularia cyperi TaxID=1882483 RepID=A0A317Y1Z2_9BASI|nr:hypothetical protein BCV70DRAFT_20796 [Testicularia cyperi]